MGSLANFFQSLLPTDFRRYLYLSQDYLNYKQFLLSKNFTDKEALTENYAQKVAETFQAMRPFFDYMSEILTTDLNGELII